MGSHRLSQITPVFVEKQVGDQTAPELEEAHGGVDASDPRLSRYVDQVGRRALAFSARKDFPHKFLVLKAARIVNAFALGNGNTYITRGLLGLLDDEAELAFVLGHEVGHVEKRHMGHRIDQFLGAQLLLEFAEALITGRGTRRLVVDTIGPLAADVVLNGFGRRQELEADEEGLDHTVRAGYDPFASVRVFETFRKLGPESKGIEIYLSSHPTATRRISEVRSDIRRAFPNMATGATWRARYNEIVKGRTVEPSPEERAEAEVPFISRPEFLVPAGVVAAGLLTLPFIL